MKFNSCQLSIDISFDIPRINDMIIKSIKMKTTEKIGLMSVPYGSGGIHYVRSLEEKISQLPLSKETQKILSLKLPKDRQQPTEFTIYKKEETFLFLILDRGVITLNPKKPGDWTNNFTISESSEEMEIFKKNKVSVDMIKKAFSEVNNFLKGFSFIIDTGQYEIGKKEKYWFICYSSETYNKSMQKQVKKMMKTIKK